MIKVFKDGKEIPDGFCGKLVVGINPKVDYSYQLIRNVIDCKNSVLTFEKNSKYFNVERKSGECKIHGKHD